MQDIEKLFTKLNYLIPISEEYRTDLKSLITPRYLKNKTIILKTNQLARKSWVIIEGSLIASLFDKAGNETITRIYMPYEFVTDLHSFYKLLPSRIQIRTVGNTKLYELIKSKSSILKKYPENEKLVRSFMLHENQIEATRATLIGLPFEDKITEFAKIYSIEDIEDQHGASFLGLTTDHYIAQKSVLTQSISTVNDQTNTLKNKTHLNAAEMVMKVRLYLTENFKLKDIDNTEMLALKFNTTKKTLVRVFVKLFKLTPHKFIIKMKMEYAHSLLKDKKGTVKEIAHLTGFTDVFNFSRAYKAYYGYPPKDTSM